MKGFIVVLALFVVNAVPDLLAREQSMLARVTVYWARGGHGSDRNTRQHKCALPGTRLRNGHCAVDPRRIPYGSNVVLPDGSKLAAVDTGSAVRTRRAARYSGRTPNERSAIVIDRFFETKSQALAWASTHPMFMPIKVVHPGTRAEQQQGQSFAVNNATNLNQEARFNSAVQAATANRPLVATSSSIARNPLNKLGR